MNKPMNTSPHVLHPDQVVPYQPANHTGTSNRRIIGRDTVAARHLEVLIGTISKGHGAQRHAHPSLEQASYLLRGAGVSEVYGQERHIGPGDWGFNPKGVFHSFTVTSHEPAQVLVVYAPPYQENSQGAVVHDPAHPQAEPRPPATMAVAPGPICWGGTEGARVETIVDTATAGAQHLAIHRVAAVAGAKGRARRLEKRERVLYVLDGAIEGQVDRRGFEAGAGSLVFVPEGAVWEWRCGRAGATFFVIDGFAAEPLPI
jgi:quercetin dioxygenase-like cupin family protein